MKMKGARTSLSSHLIQANMHIIITVCVIKGPKIPSPNFSSCFWQCEKWVYEQEQGRNPQKTIF